MVAERFTNQQIADALNSLGVQTPSGKLYYAQLVGATVSKLRRRDRRNTATTKKLIEMTLCRQEKG
jgi:hypothetical protein